MIVIALLSSMLLAWCLPAVAAAVVHRTAAGRTARSTSPVA